MRISVSKDYFISSIITFVTAFLLSLGAQLQSGAISPQNVTVGAFGSLALVAARAGIKAAIEYYAGINGEYNV